jgi:hypothetical protein
MSNWFSNRIIIEGTNVQQVLDAIGFYTPSSHGGPTDLTLMDVERIDKQIKDMVLPSSPETLKKEDIWEITDKPGTFPGLLNLLADLSNY